MSSVPCPTCGFQVPATADFCPNCGRPRTAVQQRLEEESRATGIPYIQLLERERSAAGVSVPTSEALRTIQMQLSQIDESLRHIDRRIREVEARVPGIEAAPPLESPLRVERHPTPPPYPQSEAVRPRVPEREPVLPPMRLERAAAPERPPVAREERPPTVTRPPAPKPREVRPQIDLEDLLSGRVLAWTGGAAILIGSIFFLSLAFSRGWIGPPARVIIGVVAATAMIGTGAWFFERRERIFGHVMAAVGLGVMNVSLLAATRLYDLIPIEPALVGVLAAATVAAVIAIRANSQIVALYGLIAALISPPMLGAEPALSTAGFVGVILLGTTAIALYRAWTWLPPVAFLLSAPQAADLLTGDINAAVGLSVLAAFWGLHALSAGGEEFRVPRGRLVVTSATLLLLDALFLVVMGFAILDGGNAQWRGLFLLGVAAAHGALGGYFLRDRGDRNPFGMLAFGTGIAAVSMAIPVQLGGPPVPIGWAAEAAALAWVYSRRKHIYAGLYAAALGALAIGHLLLFEYPVDRLGDDLSNTWPYLNANGMTLAFLLGALVVVGYFITDRRLRVLLTGIGLLLPILTMPHELSGVALIAGWSLIALAALGLQYWPALNRAGLPAYWQGLYLPAAAATALAGLHLITFELPVYDVTTASLPDTPFTDAGTLAAAILIATGVIGSFIARQRAVINGARIAAVAVAAYLLPFEIQTAAVVVGWSVLAAGLLLVGRRFADEVIWYPTAAGALLGGGLLVTLYTVAPPNRLVVREEVEIDHPLLWSGATAALGALIAALVLAVWLYRERQEGIRWVGALAGALGVYLLSVGVVDAFQNRVGGDTSFGSVQKQAQVALSILWAVLGGGAFVAGILKFGAPVRLFGLALLALATIKVFVIDLAALDTSYRVLSFIGLGILLLASSYMYQHYKSRMSRDGPGEPTQETI